MEGQGKGDDPIFDLNMHHIVAVLLRGWCTNHGGGRAGGVAGEEARPGGVTACEASPRPLRLERRRANNRRQQVELGAQVCSLAVTLRRRRARMSRSRSATTQTSGLELKVLRARSPTSAWRALRPQWWSSAAVQGGRRHEQSPSLEMVPSGTVGGR